MRFALTGSIACGKTTLVRFLRELGEFVVDADDIVHGLETPGGAAVPGIARAFGRGVLAADGGIDRAKLAEKVFLDANAAEMRKKLEGIVFPLVREKLLEAKGVCVVPLLYESGWEADFDKVVCIAAHEETQIRRMMETRNYSRDEAVARIRAQMPLAEKMKRADFVIENNSTVADLRSAAERCVAWMNGLRKAAGAAEENT